MGLRDYRDYRDYLRILSSPWRFVLVWLLIGIGGAGAAFALTTRTYDAHKQLFVAVGEESDARAYRSGQFAQLQIASYTRLVDSPPVMQGVINQLNLHTSPNELAARVSATDPTGTVLIDIKAADTSPQRAQAIADATAAQVTSFVDRIAPASPGGTQPFKVSAVGPPDPPVTATGPRSPAYLGIGAVAGLVVGLGGALVRRSLDTRVKDRDGVRRALGLPTFGAVPVDPALRRAATLPDPSSSVRAAAIGQLRTRVRYLGGDHLPRSIVVASPEAADGRTAVAVDLALGLARTGYRVLLVEGDLRRPRLSGYLGLPDGPGLADLLTRQASRDAALRDWSGGLLRVLPAGSPVADPAELLARPGLAELLRVLEEQADLVLLDSPPLLPYSDAVELAAEAGDALLVIRADRTTRAQAQRALDSLVEVNSHVIGAVLNRVPSGVPLTRRFRPTATAPAPAEAHPAPWLTPRTAPAERMRPQLEADRHRLLGSHPINGQDRGGS